jgi:hypothetical protein
MTLRHIPARIWTDIRTHRWLIPALLLLLAYIAVSRVFFSATCPFYRVLGIPCAGCGMSRAAYFALTGQFARAFYLNPLIFVIVLFAIYCFVFRYILGQAIPGFIAGLITIPILMIIFYIIRMYLYFPDRVPYVYNYGNLLEQSIPGYRDFIMRILGR